MAFSSSDRDRLLADPKAFMDRIVCAVAQECSKPTLFGKPDKLTFAEDPMVRGYRQVWLGDDIGMDWVPAYMLRKKRGTDTVWFYAYLVEYGDNKTPLTVLGQAATLCFTANMNGCTFGIGSQSTATSSLVVTHSNSRGHGSQEGNVSDQRLKAGFVVGTGGRLFEPEHYRSHGKQSITFGYRKPGKKWKFCFLSYRRSRGIVTSYGVQDILTNRVTG